MTLESASSDSDRLLEVVVRLSAKLDRPLVWEDIVCSTTSLLGCESGALLLAQEGAGPRLAATVALTDMHRQVLEGLAEGGLAWLERNGRRLANAELNGFSLARGWRADLVTTLCRTAIFFPFTTQQGELQAVLVVFYTDPQNVMGRELQLLSQLALILGSLISNAQAQRSARRIAAAAGRRARKLQYLSEACAALSLAGGGSAALERAASLATSWMADRCVIEILENDSPSAATYAVCRLQGEWCSGAYGPAPDLQRQGWLEKLMRTGAPIQVHGLNPEQIGVPLAACCGSVWRPGVSLSLLSLPLRRRGRVIGAMTLLRHEVGQRTYDQDDLVFATEIARHTELALDYQGSPGAGKLFQHPAAHRSGVVEAR